MISRLVTGIIFDSEELHKELHKFNIFQSTLAGNVIQLVKGSKISGPRKKAKVELPESSHFSQ